MYESLGEKFNLLGNYDYYTNNQIALSDYAISNSWDSEGLVKKFELGADNQGIECVVNRLPDINIVQKINGSIYDESYQIILDQHNSEKFSDLVKAVKIIYAHPKLKPREQPIIRQQQYFKQNSTDNQIPGIVPARATIQIESNKHYKFY